MLSLQNYQNTLLDIVTSLYNQYKKSSNLSLLFRDVFVKTLE